MFFKKFRYNYTTDNSEIGLQSEEVAEGGEVLGIGTMIECFQEVGKELVFNDRLKIQESGDDIEEAVAFKRKGVRLSGPGEELLGKEEINLWTMSGEVKVSSEIQCGLGGGGKEEGSLVKNSENVVLRRLALERSVVAVRVDVLRSGMDEWFFRRDLT